MADIGARTKEHRPAPIHDNPFPAQIQRIDLRAHTETIRAWSRPNLGWCRPHSDLDNCPSVLHQLRPWTRFSRSIGMRQPSALMDPRRCQITSLGKSAQHSARQMGYISAKRGSSSANCSQFRSNLVRLWQTFGQCLLRPTEIGPNSALCIQILIWPDLVQILPNLSDCGRARPKFGRVRAKLRRSQPNLAKGLSDLDRPTFTELREHLADFGRSRGRVRSKSSRFGRCLTRFAQKFALRPARVAQHRRFPQANPDDTGKCERKHRHTDFAAPRSSENEA